jgi:hypothetical protein
MAGKLSIASAVGAILFAPTTLFAQGVGGAVNAGAAVRGAVVRGIPTPADLGASNPAYYRSVQKHSQAPKKLRHRH